MRARLIAVTLAAAALLAAPAVATGAGGGHWAFRAPAARPTDHPDPNRNAYTAPEAPSSPVCRRHFCVHWVTVGLDAPDLSDGDGDGVPDFAGLVLSIAEHVDAVETEVLGWRPPQSDRQMGGGRAKTDIYLAEIGGALFGYAAPDRGQRKGRRVSRRLHGYLVLDNDYARDQFPHTTPLRDLEVAIAHEYSHILQFGYDAYQDPWFAESTAVWMEDEVYGGVNDYLRYVRRWVRRSGTPLTANSIKQYGSAVWNKWLARRYGPEVIRSAWARALHTRPRGFSVAAYDAAIRAAGGSDFSRDFARFARDTAEWRTDAVFAEGHLYPDVSRRGRLPTDGQVQRLELDHAAFQLLRVPADRGRALLIRVRVPRGLAAGVALVGRTGSERHGRVFSRLRFKPRGGTMAVRISRPGRFRRLTAVLVNADARAGRFSARRLDWTYLTDSAPFRVSARVLR